MKFSKTLLYASILGTIGSLVESQEFTGNMVKMCLVYSTPSGHARSDPILNQTCASDHVHTFYGPQNFHPNTSYEDIRDTDPRFSSTRFIENNSLYWHPSIYKVMEDDSGIKTYTRVNKLKTTAYYRWDNSVLPRTEAFPPGFRMIAVSDDNVRMERCNYDSSGREDCRGLETLGGIDFPEEDYAFVGIAMAMPTCWNGDLGIDNDHISHMAYTVDGSVAGDCPEGYDRRLPEVQLFIRIKDYEGETYQYTFSDEKNTWHVDYMNGWEEGKLQDIIENCESATEVEHGYHPPCECLEFLSENEDAPRAVCDVDTRSLILDEETEVVNELPRGTCEGPELIEKFWDLNPPLSCVDEEEDDDDFGIEDDDDDDDEDDDDEDEDDDEDDDDFGIECRGSTFTKLKKNLRFVFND